MDDQRRQPATPLLPARARRPAALVMAVCAAVTVVLGALYWHSSRPGFPNQAIDSWLTRHLSGHTRALILVHDLGQPVQVAIIGLVIALACLAFRRINGALLTVISLPLAAVLTEKVLKPLFDHRLGGSPDYPSGHTCATFALATIITVLLLNPASSRPRPAVRIAVVVIAALAGCAVGVAMIGLGFHYFTDTIGGAAVGIGVVLATAFGIDMLETRRRGPVDLASRQRIGDRGSAIYRTRS